VERIETRVDKDEWGNPIVILTIYAGVDCSTVVTSSTWSLDESTITLTVRRPVSGDVIYTTDAIQAVEDAPTSFTLTLDGSVTVDWGERENGASFDIVETNAGSSPYRAQKLLRGRLNVIPLTVRGQLSV
jgi:hypothetical protein